MEVVKRFSSSFSRTLATVSWPIDARHHAEMAFKPWRRVHVAKAVVVGSDLETGGEMMAIASDGGFEVRECVVNHVEVHVIQTTLVPSGSMVG